MLVKVWNDNVHEYREKFRDMHIIIPAQTFIEMDEDEAIYFKSAFTFPMKDAQGKPDPKYFKKIRLEYPETYHGADVDPLVCHANGQKASSEAALEKLLTQFSDRMAKDDELDKRSSKNLKKQNDELLTRIEALEKLLLGGKNAESV